MPETEPTPMVDPTDPEANLNERPEPQVNPVTTPGPVPPPPNWHGFAADLLRSLINHGIAMELGFRPGFLADLIEEYLHNLRRWRTQGHTQPLTNNLNEIARNVTQQWVRHPEWDQPQIEPLPVAMPATLAEARALQGQPFTLTPAQRAQIDREYARMTGRRPLTPEQALDQILGAQTDPAPDTTAPQLQVTPNPVLRRTETADDLTIHLPPMPRRT